MAKARAILAANTIVIAVTRARFPTARRAREALIADTFSFKANAVAAAVASTSLEGTILTVPARSAAAFTKRLLAFPMATTQIWTQFLCTMLASPAKRTEALPLGAHAVARAGQVRTRAVVVAVADTLARAVFAAVCRMACTRSIGQAPSPSQVAGVATQRRFAVHANPSLRTGAISSGTHVHRNAGKSAFTPVAAGGRAHALSAAFPLPAFVALTLAVQTEAVGAAVSGTRLHVARYTAEPVKAATAVFFAHAVTTAAVDTPPCLLFASSSTVSFLANAGAVVANASLTASRRADSVVAQ